MRWFSRRLFSLGMAVSALFLVAGAGNASLYSSNGFYNVTFNNPTNTKYIDKRASDFIDAAQSYCYVAIYALNRQRIVDSLIERHQAGVDVRVVTEADNRNHPSYKAAYDQLEAAGIVVKTDNRSALMHHKFIVVDDNEVLTGSYNFTDEGTQQNKNNLLVIHSSGVASRFKGEFLEMWAGRFGNAKADFSGRNTVSGATVYTKFGPKANLRASLLYHLNTANVSVYFNIFTFTDQSIADKLVELHQRGVTVKGTMDAYQATDQYSQYQYLVANGLPIKRDAYAGLLHDKFIAIDAGTASTPKLITGSANWTAAADEENDEDMLVIYDYDTVGRSYKGNAVYVYNYKAY